jgi:hypothetical protein
MRFKSKTVVLALVAVFACSAVAVASASAALPEFKPVPTKKKFTDTSGAVYFRAGTETIKCTASTTSGEITSTSTLGKTVEKLTGCQWQTAGGVCPLHSVGAKEGEIVTNSLTGELGTVFTTKEAASGVGLLLEPTTGTVWATIAPSAGPCNSIETALEGKVAGEVAAIGKKATTNTLVFGVTSGKQDIKEITLDSGKVVKPKFSGWGIAAWTTEASDALTFEEALEVT